MYVIWDLLVVNSYTGGMICTWKRGDEIGGDSITHNYHQDMGSMDYIYGESYAM